MSELDVSESSLVFEPSDLVVADGWITREARSESAPGYEYVVLASARSQHEAALDSFTRSLSATAEVEPAEPADPADPEALATESPSVAVDIWTSHLPPDLGEDPFIVAEFKVIASKPIRAQIEMTGGLGQDDSVQLRASNGARVSCNVTGGKVRFTVWKYDSPGIFRVDLDTGDKSPDVKSDGRASVMALKKARFGVTGNWEPRP